MVPPGRPPRRPDPRREERTPASGRGAGEFLERWILPYVREPTLWPVLLVALAHVMAFVGPLLLLALRDRRGGAGAALVLLVLLTGAGIHFEVRRLRRPGAIYAMLLTTWLGSAGAALLANRFDLF